MSFFNESTPELLTFPELCDYLSLSESVCYSLLRNKKIEACKIGHIWRIPRASIDKYIIEQCKVQNKS